MAIVSNKSISDKVFTLLHTLSSEQLVEVVHFMEFLKTKETEETIEKETIEDPFLTYITREADPKVSLDQVRASLESIKGNVSDVVIKGREERL